MLQYIYMNDTKSLSIKHYIESDAVKNQLSKVLGSKSQQFTISLLSIVNSNTLLAKCDPKSIYSAAMIAASLDLPINQNLGFAYIIPYGDQAQFQMGAKGFKQLAIRTGAYKTINETDVKEGEYKGINRLTGEIECDWDQSDERNAKKTVGYLAYFKLLNGYEKYRYMTMADLEKHGKRYSQTYKKGFGNWKDDFDAMARKTVVKLLLSKDGILSSELQEALIKDQGVLSDEGVDYVDNKRESAEDISNEKERQRLIKYINEAKTLEELEKCKRSCVEDETAELYLKKEAELKEAKKPEAPKEVNKNGQVS